eukprot:TRINITY_DN43572_c0_g1_i4.p1 TRINITY_DN43572_c0_g1~~TRINITY_DN43572_c0_g1_i4.p1  ORF type:complete len:267 (+),score=22.92 TRINITY_DN43572_c0_g1_i4:245-1045(+)
MGNIFGCSYSCTQCGRALRSPAERTAHQGACIAQAHQIEQEREQQRQALKRLERERLEQERQERERWQLERAVQQRQERERRQQERAEQQRREQELEARTCRDCDRMFVSPTVLADHLRSGKHKKRVKAIEAEAAREAKLLRQVEKRAHALNERLHREAKILDPPFPGIEGYWELHIDCPFNLKSFAFFECQCRNRWSSAHGFQKYKQGCKRCDSMSFPKFMWINTHTGHPIRDSYKTEDSMPHHQDRCEACRNGECVAALQFRRV